MSQKSRGPDGHTGHTQRGNTRDIKVERVGPVTIYKRGLAYYLYYREKGKSRRDKVDGNLAVARATASKVAAALAEHKPSPVGFQRTPPEQMVTGYLEYIDQVKGLALRTQDRYRAALERFLEFCRDTDLASIDVVQEETIGDFVKWLRGQERARNGSKHGKRDVYKLGGIKFILSTCRTTFNWAARRRMLPPFSDNPFSRFPIEKLRDRQAPDDSQKPLFTVAQENAFFAACDEWQGPIFEVLRTYGLRVAELTHLLIEEVDFNAGSIRIRSKPELYWSVKTGRVRELPILPSLRPLLERLIGDRHAGFVFLNRDQASGSARLPHSFPSPGAFQSRLRKIVEDLLAKTPNADERAKLRAVTRFCRSMGQMPDKRVREEFMKLTRKIGCPEFTRAHDLRHLFASRAQEADVNPLLVQDLLGHQSLEMTRRYTHLGLEAKRNALTKLGRGADEPASSE